MISQALVENCSSSTEDYGSTMSTCELYKTKWRKNISTNFRENSRPLKRTTSSMKLSGFLFQNYYLFCCALLLVAFGGTVTTCLPSISNLHSRNAEAASHDELSSGGGGSEDSQMQFIRPVGGAKIGTTTGFFKASDLFRAAINESVKPCDDFYEFACGRWIATNKIPNDLTSYGHFSELREKVNMEMKDLFEDKTNSTSNAINTVKQVYKGCMNVERLNEKKSTALQAKLVEFGYWPIIHGAVNQNESESDGLWSADKFNLTALLAAVSRSRDTDTFIDVYIALDQRNVTRRLLHFDQGGLGLGASARDYYINGSRYAKQLNAYEAYMNAKISLLAMDAGMNRSKSEIAEGVKKILEFEKEFAKILVPEDERRNYTKMYNIRRFSQLSDIFNEINWDAYFRFLMPEDMHEYLESDPEIVVNELEFFDRLKNLLKNTDKSTVVNYVLWRYASAWSFQLDERYDDIQQDFLKSFIGKQTKSPRWKDCSSAASSRLSYASGAMYVRRHFQKSDRDAALEMIEDLRSAFKQMLTDNDWMEPETKEIALEKANDMISLIGFPDFIYNDTALDDYYTNLTLNSDEDYATMIENASEWAQRKAFRRLQEEVDRSEFGSSSAVVNAFYSSVKNAITFPAAILQAPFFDRSFPRAVNYGGIGAVIGHEITHGFDDQGSQFDKLGNLDNWWDATTHSRFLKRTQCIIDEYSNFEVPETNLKINGVLTQGENIADNGGIKQAFRAYRSLIKRLGHEENRLPGLESYTNDQIFFISYAQTWCGQAKPETAIRQILIDPHSPMRFRVNGVVINQPEFAEAFKCDAGSPMNPEKKCAVW